MRLRRYQEENMQKAMAKVRAELGKDAVLISSRRVNNGIEVTAASDYDPEKLDAEILNTPPVNPVEESEPSHELRFEITGEKDKKVLEQGPSLVDMQEELGRLRKLFEGELAQLVWRDSHNRQPNRMALLSRLETTGISHDLSAKIVEKILPCDDLELSWKRALRLLVRAVKKPELDPLSDGGIIALVGPSGVGKTTTAVKMAAQFALQYGRNEVALITTDDYRVGQREQLISLCSSLGLPVQVAIDEQEMQKTLDSFSERKLVIIDTAGVNPRSKDLAKQYEVVLGKGKKISSYLVLSATAQESVLNETIRSFSRIAPTAAIVTKTDENLSIGPALSSLIRNRLPAAYLGIGQNIPEDLLYATPEFFINKLVESYEDSINRMQKRAAAAG